MQYNQLQTPRVENLARRLLGIRNGGVVPTLSPELGLDLAMPQLRDVLPLAGYLPWGGWDSGPAVAGQASFVSLANLTSGQLFGVKAIASINVAQQVVFLMEPVRAGALIAASNWSWLDSRRNRLSLPVNANGIQITHGSSAAAFPLYGGAGGAFKLSQAVVGTEYSAEVVLAPGMAVTVFATTVNTDLFVTFEAWLRDFLTDELVI